MSVLLADGMPGVGGSFAILTSRPAEQDGRDEQRDYDFSQPGDADILLSTWSRPVITNTVSPQSDIEVTVRVDAPPGGQYPDPSCASPKLGYRLCELQFDTSSPRPSSNDTRDWRPLPDGLALGEPLPFGVEHTVTVSC